MHVDGNELGFGKVLGVGVVLGVGKVLGVDKVLGVGKVLVGVVVFIVKGSVSMVSLSSPSGTPPVMWSIN